jgi:2-polyprenyl-3-methyl-5-hydroxy-6-metoxy-1,4-benzoquinol methylase
MDKLIYEEMFRIEETHWWFVARRKIITHLIEKMIPKLNHSKEKILICDLGCGCGATLKVLSQKYNVYGMEASDDAIKFCRERGLNIQKGELPHDVPYEENRFSVVLILDVLEHIADEDKAVKKAVSLLRPGGIVICTVPAYQWLWTRHDEIHHHKRRYTKKRISELFNTSSKILPVILTYYNTLLFPLALVERITSKIMNKKQNRPQISYPNKILNMIFEKIFGVERFLIPKITFPFGLSIIGIFQKIYDTNFESV